MKEKRWNVWRVLTAAEWDAKRGLLGIQIAIAAAISFGAVGPDGWFVCVVLRTGR